METPKSKIAILIPCFKEGRHIADVARRCLATGLRVIVVDDGSPDDTAEQARSAGAEVLVHETNKGKGAALATGIRHAYDAGCAAVITLDGDGQHAPEEVARFVEKHAADNSPMIVGSRMADTAAMPIVRRVTNRFMSWLLSLQLGQRVHDSQCGFRLLSREIMPLAIGCTSGGYSAESEILLQVALNGYAIHEVPISTIYGDEVSKIHPVRDTLRFIKMLAHFRRQRRERLRKMKVAQK